MPQPKRTIPGLELLTAEQVADILQITIRTLRTPKMRELIRPIHLGGRLLRYDAADVKAALEKMKEDRS